MSDQRYNHDAPVFGLTAHLNALEDYSPGRQQYPFRWIPSGVFYDLIDDRSEEDPVFDRVTGYTNRQFFAALTSDVTSIRQFRDKLLLNSGNNQQNEVNTLFSSYGY
jgi:hypothetical protein